MRQAPRPSDAQLEVLWPREISPSWDRPRRLVIRVENARGTFRSGHACEHAVHSAKRCNPSLALFHLTPPFAHHEPRVRQHSGMFPRPEDGVRIRDEDDDMTLAAMGPGRRLHEPSWDL